MEDSRPFRCYLITHPRTASNLLVRILALENQPDVAQHRPGAHGGCFFCPANRVEIDLGLRERNIEEWSEGQRNQLKEKIQDCFANLEEYLDGADAEGKMAFVKEHGFLLIDPSSRSAKPESHGTTSERPWTVKVSSKYGFPLTRSSLNNTIFPDEFLTTWSPVFLIRHPALVFPSQYRVMRDLKTLDSELRNTLHLDLMTTLSWIRSLYDFWSDYLEKSSGEIKRREIWPIILDADDIISNREVVLEFSKLIGLDPTKLKYEWQPEVKTSPSVFAEFVATRLLATLRTSSGIMLEKMASDINIDVEAKKWSIEFGDKAGRYLEKRVRSSMPDYEYMKAIYIYIKEIESLK